MLGHRILAVLKKHYHPRVGLSVATLARALGASESHVRVVAKELVASGRIAYKRGYPMAFQYVPEKVGP